MHNFSTDQIDYSEYGETGYFCSESQTQYVLSKGERCLDQSRNLLIIGFAGVDGIEFVLTPDGDSVYAYYPINSELIQLAPDFTTFISGWIDGKICV